MITEWNFDEKSKIGLRNNIYCDVNVVFHWLQEGYDKFVVLLQVLMGLEKNIQVRFEVEELLAQVVESVLYQREHNRAWIGHKIFLIDFVLHLIEAVF